TAAGTAMYEDLNPGSASSDPIEITASEWNLADSAQLPLWYFSANDATHGRELFVAYPDSPPADVYDINPGAASSDPGPFVPVVEETGLVAATGAPDGRELYDLQTPPPPPRLEGQQPGTATLVPGVSPGAGSNPVLGPTGLIGTAPPAAGRAALPRCSAPATPRTAASCGPPTGGPPTRPWPRTSTPVRVAPTR